MAFFSLFLRFAASFAVLIVVTAVAMTWSIFWGSLIAVLLALVLSYCLARVVRRPLFDLTFAVRSVAAGNYERRVSSRRGDEIGQLAESFNRMAEELRGRVAKLTDEHAKLTTILSSMSEGVVAVDGEERVIHLNQVAAELIDADLRDGVGRHLWEVTRVSEVCQILSRVLESGVSQSAEATILRGDKDLRVDIDATPLLDGSGQSVGAVAVLQDLTTLKRLEVIRTDFVTNVSHELKTPITAIQGLADTLTSDDQMPAGTRSRFLERIAAQSRVLAGLVTDLLTLARLEAEDSGAEHASFDLADPAQAVLEATSNLAEDRGISVTLEGPAGECPVVGDDELVRVAINNLVENAIKYNPEGTRIRVCVRADNGSGVVEVQDDGVGIDPVHQERVFERFYRVDKARSRELGGTGLGLSIVKHICRTHGGDVELESQPAHGTTFRIRLPLRGAQGALKASKPAQS